MGVEGNILLATTCGCIGHKTLPSYPIPTFGMNFYYHLIVHFYGHEEVWNHEPSSKL